MKELDCQKLIVDVVRTNRGAAHKLSNRFLVGVVDLLVKLPKYRAALIEAKLHHFAKSMPVSHMFVPDVTKLQGDFLNIYGAAGMSVGLASFVELGHKGIKELYVNVVSDYVRGTALMIGNHHYLGDPTTRNTEILAQLKELCGHDA